MPHIVRTDKCVEFSDIVWIDDRQTVITNGVVEKYQFPNISPSPNKEDLIAAVNYMNRIIDAIDNTKKKFNSYKHNHRTAEQKMRKHDYQGSSDLHCTQCGKTVEEGNHYKR